MIKKSMSNPAFRLHQILKKGMEYNSNSKTKDVWQEILEVEDDFQIFGKICSVQSLIDEMISTFKIHDPDDYKEYFSWLPNLERAFNKQDLDGNWGTFKSSIGAATLSGIYTTARAMSSFTDIPPISDQQLAELRAKTLSLIEDFRSSEIEGDIKIFILEHLYSIISAIEDYQIKGSEFLIEKIERAAGSVAIKAKASKISPDKLANFWDYLGNAATLVGIFNGIRDLSGLESPAEFLKLALQS